MSYIRNKFINFYLSFKHFVDYSNFLFAFSQCGHLTQRQHAGLLWKQKEIYRYIFLS